MDICSNVRVLLTGLVLAVVAAGNAYADVEGTWLSEDGGSHILIKPCGEKMCGEVVWLKEPLDKNGNAKVDIRNKDESLRDQPIIGLFLIWDMSAAGDGKWKNGKIYNPRDGKTYNSKMELVDANSLKVTGCILIFCKSEKWTRVEQADQ